MVLTSWPPTTRLGLVEFAKKFPSSGSLTPLLFYTAANQLSELMVSNIPLYCLLRLPITFTNIVVESTVLGSPSDTLD
jgi:hypothetical protein